MAGAAATAGACDDPARPFPPRTGGGVAVESDPPGGLILVDGTSTDVRTPATLTDVVEGVREIRIVLDTLGLEYFFARTVRVQADRQARVAGPLTLRCADPQCASGAAIFHSPGRARFAVNAGGPLFFYAGQDQGIVWPEETANTYAAAGVPIIGGRVDSEPLALGIYNYARPLEAWAGRPAPRTEETDSGTVVHQTAWIHPAGTAEPALRGIAVDEEIFVPDDLADVIVVRLTFRNISADSVYRLLDPGAPEEGVTIAEAHLGFAMDADIGAFSEADDDLVGYDAGRSLVFAYDSDFSVNGFSGGWSTRPGMVGLMLLDGPGSAASLSAWAAAADWLAGSGSVSGYDFLRGRPIGLPDHPHDAIGFAPDSAAADYRMAVTRGPIDLAPGEQATVTVAVLLAAPRAGTFQTGALLPAGDPSDPGRPSAAVAAGLFALADSVRGAQAPATTSGN